MLKKFFALALALVLTATLFCGCTRGNDGGKLKIVTTVFPEYDWVNNILGEKAKDADVTLLLDNGVDIHSYQPSASDIVKISACDIFVYVGGESDDWVDDALEEATNKRMKVINLLEVLGNGAKNEEVIEGMQDDDRDDDDDDDDRYDRDDDDGIFDKIFDDDDDRYDRDYDDYDEHVWLSLKNASLFCDAICTALKSADKENAAIYESNNTAYKQKLADLDKEYENAVNSANSKTLLFADRFPFRYLVDDYGLSYFAAFVGCSAESEASFETIAFLSKKTDELSLPAVFTLEGNGQKIAKTVIASTESKSAQILSLNSMQSNFKGSDTYLSIMRENLDVLGEYFKMPLLITK